MSEINNQTNKENTNIEENNEQSIDLKNKEINSLQKQLDDYLDQLKRAQAEFINYKARVLKDTQDLVFLQTKEIALELISFKELLLLSTKNEEHEEARRVLNLLLDKLDNSLSRLNIKKIELNDSIPDYNLCECVGTVKTTISEEDNMIKEILEAGYLYNDKLIKPVKIIINKLEE